MKSQMNQLTTNYNMFCDMNISNARKVVKFYISTAKSVKTNQMGGKHPRVILRILYSIHKTLDYNIIIILEYRTSMGNFYWDVEICKIIY